MAIRYVGLKVSDVCTIIDMDAAYHRQYRANRTPEHKEGIKRERREQYRNLPEDEKERLKKIMRDYSKLPESKLNQSKRMRARNFKVKYGLTVKQWEEMFENQGRRCAICETDQTSKGWAVDHCHFTKRVRAILCNKCNLGLGHFGDSHQMLEKALSYLLRHSEG